MTVRTKTERPFDIRKATDCHCVPPDRCDCTEARVHAAELTATFNLRWEADMRAIKRWQAAHPGNGLVWPDHADMVVWLMEQVASQVGDYRCDVCGSDDRNEHNDEMHAQEGRW